jgi:hypothetical protein
MSINIVLTIDIDNDDGEIAFTARGTAYRERDNTNVSFLAVSEALSDLKLRRQVHFQFPAAKVSFEFTTGARMYASMLFN